MTFGASHRKTWTFGVLFSVISSSYSFQTRCLELQGKITHAIEIVHLLLRNYLTIFSQFHRFGNLVIFFQSADRDGTYFVQSTTRTDFNPNLCNLERFHDFKLCPSYDGIVLWFFSQFQNYYTAGNRAHVMQRKSWEWFPVMQERDKITILSFIDKLAMWFCCLYI